MSHQSHEHGIDFGHEFHGREHHFLITRDALEYLDGGVGLDERGLLDAYNAHLKRIHRVAEDLSKTADSLTRIVIDRPALEAA